MSFSITHYLSAWDSPDKIPNGGLRIAMNDERIHRFKPDNRPTEATQEWGPMYVGVYPELDIRHLVDASMDLINQYPSSFQHHEDQYQQVTFCESSFALILDRLDETYIRLAVRSKDAVPEAQRGYLVTIDVFVRELIAALDRFIEEVEREAAGTNVADGLVACRQLVQEEVL